MEALSGVKGDNSLKIFGPGSRPARAAGREGRRTSCKASGASPTWASSTSAERHTSSSASIQQKCQKWGVSTADVNNVVSSAVGAKAMSSMVEGEKLFDISIRWPKWRRDSETSILDIPVDIINNQVVLPQGSGFTPNASGHALPPPPSQAARPTPPTRSAARRGMRLGDLVTPGGRERSRRMPAASSIAPATRPSIVRQGKRLIAIKFSVRGRDLGSAVDEAKEEDEGAFQDPLPRGLERRVRADGGGQRPPDVDHSPVARADLHPALLGVPTRSWTRS